MNLRQFMDRIAPRFRDGARLRPFYPVYEAIDTALYTPDSVTGGPSHIRDVLNLKRVMMTVWLCAFIPAFAGAYFMGQHANEALQALHQTTAGAASGNWRYLILNVLTNYNPTSVWDNLIHGLSYFIPLYIVVFLSGIAFEAWFAAKRGHEINEGFFVTSILFTLTLPPTTPLWMAALGVSFGVVVGKEVFGGTGKNFLNPALTGRAFLYFAYPSYMTGDSVWVAVDGFTRATPLGSAALGHDYGVSWMNAFLGNMPGALGETSTLAILLAAVVLVTTRIAAWRIMAGSVIGLVTTVLFFNAVGSVDNAMFSMPPQWHLVLGGFAFGAVFMATDPVSAAMTDKGRWLYGLLIGVMCALIRVVNPAFPEGMMLAILFSNAFAPLIDYGVMKANIKRRSARVEA